MKLWLFRVLLLVSTVGMVLPAGWCCSSVRGELFQSGQAQAAKDQAAQPKRACCQRSCCQRRAVRKTTDCGGVPGRPSVRCCCQRDAALQAKRVQQSVMPTVILPIPVSELLPVLPSVCDGAPSDWLLGEGPPLHLLQCVWRC
jgi:hypothetical protein